ncbi:Hsp20/alpha crystallin family protein [Nocardia elegans]|nr:Hsp20/alpha crystallin family protein [Nocardia nova]MBF6244604.1 Hsp20/alpha crystallin family protein [Nocardia elegans]MBF6278468.1 Hsp20/alpha crystallin family protein [Nocardia nova]MBF6451672.1 Hsp20/alpha crystallin family protein [Nocardia elegans]MBV7705897.1 Hsp20/alpha crystallin family protein [Nocardia nova]
MMNLLPAHRPGSLLPDFTDWWNAFTPGLAPMFGSHLLRVEESVDDGHYVVRTEIPGIDPAKDVEVSVHGGLLTIKAERSESHEEKGRSEFSYGSFERTVSLPEGAQDEGIDATYAKGILTVTVPMGEPKEKVTKVDVKSGD